MAEKEYRIQTLATQQGEASKRISSLQSQLTALEFEHKALQEQHEITKADREKYMILYNEQSRVKQNSRQFFAKSGDNRR